MTDHTKELEAESRRLARQTIEDVASALREDRVELMETLVFFAEKMDADHGEHAPYVTAVAGVARRLEVLADCLEHIEEQAAFNLRALEQGIGRSA